MIEKFEFYDVLGILVPGILAICFSIACFPALTHLTSGLGFPDSFALLALLALAIFLGNVIQAVSSLLEPLLYATWGGRPSERALVHGLGERYLPRDAAKRIRGKLITKFGENASNRSLFLSALNLSEGASPRVGKFNGLFAYHRALLTLELIFLLTFLTSMWWGAAATLSQSTNWTLVAVAFALVLLTWHRTRQRAYYYVREVLFSAERVLEGKA
jgi:ABC-type multidrug transport system fused ATPase/permease subunit